MLGLQSADVINTQHCQLIDIRPWKERYGGLGFVVGSLSIPQSHQFDVDAATIRRLTGTKLPVLVCSTGQRAQGMALALAQMVDVPLKYLLGGVVGWQSEGLPLAGQGRASRSLQPISIKDFHQTLRQDLACSLSTMSHPSQEPAELVLNRCAMALGHPVEQCTGPKLPILLDLIAAILLDLSIDRTEVSILVDRQLARLPSSRPRHIVRS